MIQTYKHASTHSEIWLQWGQTRSTTWGELEKYGVNSHMQTGLGVKPPQLI